MTSVRVSKRLEGETAGGRPLVTFALWAYNQAEYIREAVSGALAQDYRPLQIILSDDASTDRTFELMAEASRACPADVQLILNRAAENLGIAEHMNQVLALAEGEYIVLAAGDDVSLPERTRRSVEALLSDERGRMALHSSVINIDAKGREIRIRENPHRHLTDSPHEVLSKDVYLTGSSVTVHRSIYSDFPPLLPDVVCEDKVTAFRCAFSGGAVYVDQPLVKYRAGVGVSTLHGALLSGGEDPIRETHYIRTTLARRLSTLRQIRLDCTGSPIAQRIDAGLWGQINRECGRIERTLGFMEQPHVIRLPVLIMAAGLSRKTVKIATLGLLPWLYHWYKLVRRRNRKTPAA